MSSPDLELTAGMFIHMDRWAHDQSAHVHFVNNTIKNKGMHYLALSESMEFPPFVQCRIQRGFLGFHGTPFFARIPYS